MRRDYITDYTFRLIKPTNNDFPGIHLDWISISRKRFTWRGIYPAKWLIDKVYNSFCFTDCMERMLLPMQKNRVEQSGNVVFENYAKRNGAAAAATATATTNAQITFLFRAYFNL